MIKNKVLTPVLAGVLGVSVIGSGVGYYVVNKGDKDGNTEKMDSMKISLTQVENNMTTAVDDVQKAVSGQLDYAYDSSVKITFGEALNSKMGSTGSKNTIKPIEIDTKVKQKGQNSQADISAKYNDATLITLETVMAKDSKTGYFRIPELSSAYIKASEKDIQDVINKYAEKVQSRRNQQYVDYGTQEDSSTAQNKLNAQLEKLKPQLPDLSGIDGKKLEEKLKSYAEVIKSKLPDKKDGANLTGDIDGNKYNYKTVVYSINGKQAQDALYAVLDKMASDSDIKKIFDDYMAKMKEQGADVSGVKSYAELIAQAKKQAAVPTENQNKTASLELYYDGDEISGLAVKFDGKDIFKAVAVNKKDVNAVDIAFSDGNEGNSFTVKGSAKLKDGAVNGSYAVDFKDGGKSAFTMKVTLDKVVAKENYFSGTVKIDANVNADNKTQSFSVKLSGTSSDSKKDLTVTVDVNGKNAVTVNFKLNKTEATDVAVPTENVYTLDQMDAYKKTCDIDNFKSAINDALGVNVFGMFDRLKGLAQNSVQTGAYEY